MNFLDKMIVAWNAPPFDAEDATRRMVKAVEPIVKDYFSEVVATPLVADPLDVEVINDE